MRAGLAVSIPTADQVGDAAKTLAALGGIVGGAWALVARWLRRRRDEQARRDMEAKAIRYIVDAQHHVLRLLNRGLVPADEIERQEILIRELRKDLAKVDGHEELLAASDRQEEIVQVITRTQAIRQRKQELATGDNPFKDGWTPDGDAKP